MGEADRLIQCTSLSLQSRTWSYYLTLLRKPALRCSVLIRNISEVAFSWKDSDEIYNIKLHSESKLTKDPSTELNGCEDDTPWGLPST